ncbi:MAG: alkaline phosphatase family protein [Cyanobacteria bacterium]|nr:alkaline phosphatase family protein [Cyanobacteriota bacterium]
MDARTTSAAPNQSIASYPRRRRLIYDTRSLASCVWRSRAHRRRVAVVALGCVLAASPVEAYIGPGAGFALISSAFVLLTTVVLALASLLVWPFRAAMRSFRRLAVKPLIKRLVIVGFDGQDPTLTDRFMAAGKLPNFTRLAQRGSYHRLRTTFPAVSPVAWSSFSTGVSPARHNIFDFLDRDLRSYLPVLSSTFIGRAMRTVKIGRFRVPLSRPDLRLLRRSKPFWSILGEHDVWSTILRVPITFPPDRFHGAQLSAMCVPDLLGTQGTFTVLTTRPPGSGRTEGGVRGALQRTPAGFEGAVHGPPNTFVDGEPAMVLPLSLRADGDRARLTISGRTHVLEPGRLSEWIPLAFPAVPLVTVRGICRMLVTEIGEHATLYISPINIDPEKPAMPVSHPPYYATYLAKKIGPYATLGLAEDTWALNERVIDEATFLKQTCDIDAERERMLFAGLDQLRRGSLVCVFDATDRIQHMFWRYLDPAHPAHPSRRGDETPEHQDAIEALYVRNDALVGRMMARLQDGDVLMVLSDHGFTSFRRGVNLNRWLLDHGYLTLKRGGDPGAEWLRDVDWSMTRAYAMGLTGLFLNLKGREPAGIVEPADAARLRHELVASLSGLRDEHAGTVGITEVFDTRALYNGPYVENAPDLLIGYNAGYRTSWAGAKGVVAGDVFEDNTKAWSGDHCIDPRQVPGILFCSRAVTAADPALIDIAPTALHLFGIRPPSYMEGKVLLA